MLARFRLSCGLLLVALLAFAHAGKVFWLFRQHVKRQREQQAMRQVQMRWQLQSQFRPAMLNLISTTVGLIPQPLDHFNRQERRIFNQRYWINEQFWQRPTGPIFLYIGGEETLSPFSVMDGHHVDLAEKYRAMVVALEHRFYGTSLNPDGLQDENLQFLSSQQAFNLSAFAESPSDLVFAAIASSAPVKAQMDYTDYNKTGCPESSGI
ncbi:hypothetical protein E2320_000755 [Naja naja]|nr:hypothetical protein E2320_000755 [Naja naja]